jgi:pyruvate dehydrogenase E2 component (dihydrolipoamide acetyltransferase)
MPIEIRMPRLASDMESADVVTWLAKPGDRIEKGDLLLELETEKSTVELEAPATGVLAEILVPAGTPDVAVGRVLGLLEAEDAAAVEPAAVSEEPATEQEPESPATPAPTLTTPAVGDDVHATALARRIADRAGLDLSEVQGSGARGRITRSDVEQSLGSETTAPAAPTAQPKRDVTTKPAHGGQEIPHTRMRRTIATRLTEAKRTIPHFYLHVDCQVDALLAARARMNEAEGVRVSVNDFIVRAAALALCKVPAANVSWGEEAMIQHESVDIAIAVATEGGLITPIVRDADLKGLADLSVETRELAERARAGRLAPTEYQGGSMSVSNLGMYGVDSVYPNLNPPQSCILGVGRASEQPVVRDAEVAVGTVMTLTLCADHRAVDGAVGAELLAAIRRHIEQPLAMLL